MLGETLQSTCAVANVMASASDISFCIDSGIAEFGAGWPNPYFCRPGVFELARPELRQIGARNQREDNIRGKSFL